MQYNIFIEIQHMQCSTIQCMQCNTTYAMQYNFQFNAIQHMQYNTIFNTISTIHSHIVSFRRPRTFQGFGHPPHLLGGIVNMKLEKCVALANGKLKWHENYIMPVYV